MPDARSISRSPGKSFAHTTIAIRRAFIRSAIARDLEPEVSAAGIFTASTASGFAAHPPQDRLEALEGAERRDRPGNVVVGQIQLDNRDPGAIER